MAPSRYYTRRIRWVSLNHPGNEKWTPASPAPASCVIGLALRTNTAKPTASYRRIRIEAAQRELSRNNGERFLAPGYACVCSPRRMVPSLPRHGIS